MNKFEKILDLSGLVALIMHLFIYGGSWFDILLINNEKSALLKNTKKKMHWVHPNIFVLLHIGTLKKNKTINLSKVGKTGYPLNLPFLF